MKYRLINSINPNLSPIQQILVNRGVHSSKIEDFIKTNDSVIINPLKLNNLNKGVMMLLKAIKEKKKMLVQVDSDCDGYTSAAVFINYMYKVFPSYCLNHIDIRLHEGKEHGIILDTVLGKDYGIVVAPDASSNEYEIHKTLSDNGIDVLVLDHHEASRESECATVINNQLSKDYTNKDLSGVGIVYKFIKHIDSMLKLDCADNYLDLVALGMIADMMDMRSLETKHLISKGVSSIKSPFINGLIDRQAYSIGESVTPIGMAFYIAPLVNATIRMGSQEEKEIMFKAMLEHLAYSEVPSTKRGEKGKTEAIITQAVRQSINIRTKQNKARDEGKMKISSLIEAGGTNSKIIALEIDDSVLDKRLTGLVANQLISEYKKPVLLLRKNKEGVLCGSGRGYDKIKELPSFRDYLLNTGLVDYAEGHANALGVGIKEDNLKVLIDKTNEILNHIEDMVDYDVDFIYSAEDFKAQDIIDISSMKPLWGKYIEESYIAVEGIKITKQNIQLMSPNKKPTLRITLPNGVSIIKFRSSQEEYESLCSEGFIEINIVGKASINEWNGNISPQILVQEYEIVTKKKYYF